jgi:cytochrome c
MSFEMNKIAGAILASMIVAMIAGFIASALVKPKMPDKNAYEIAITDQPAMAAPAAPAAPEPIGPLLAAANVANGQSDAKVCLTCHTFDKGGPNRIGPNLYGIFGDEIAHGRGGFAFSDALSGKGGTWTVDNLNAWLTNPQVFAKGTKMTFAGFPKAKDRADVIAYLNSLSDSPKPLPASAPAKPASAAPAQPAGK